MRTKCASCRCGLLLHVLLSTVLWLRAMPARSQPQAVEAPAGSEESPVEDYEHLLQEGENNWLYGDYGQVVRLLAPILFPEPVADLDESQRIEAYVLVGSSYFFLGERNASEQAFHALLRIDPDYNLDRLLYPATVINFLDEIRRIHQEELDAIREARGQTPGEQTGRILYVERRVSERSWWISALPFGIGHFANRQVAWGIAYLATELALGGTSIGMYVASESARDADGFYPDPDRARTYQTIQVVTAYSFFAVLLVNVVHGAIIHEGVLETSYRTLEEPPHFDTEGESLYPFGTVTPDEGGFLFGIGGRW